MEDTEEDGGAPAVDRDRRREKTGGEESGTALYAVHMLMENLHDKLKMLDYDTKFCARFQLKPIARHYFAIPGSGSEQLNYFAALMSWLLSLAGHNFPAPAQYDDPNTITSNIVAELKKLGTPIDFPPSRLRMGSGEEVCQILNNFAQQALKAQNWKWQKPVHTADDQQEEPDSDANEAEITAGRMAEAEEIDDETYDDDDDAVIDPENKGRPTAAEATAQREILAPTVDMAQWRMEVERVLPQLKVHLRSDVKDWRTHLEQMEQYKEGIQGSLVETKTHLDKLHNEIAHTLEKISSREKYLNKQLEHLMQEFRLKQDSLASATERYNVSSASVTGLTQELARLTEELDSIKAQMDERGSSMTDAGPLVKIRQAMTKIKTDTAQMDLRIGVVQHILLAAKLRNKSALVLDMNAGPIADELFF